MCPLPGSWMLWICRDTEGRQTRGKKKPTNWAGTRLGKEPKYRQWKCHSQAEAHKACLRAGISKAEVQDKKRSGESHLAFNMYRGELESGVTNRVSEWRRS